MEEDGEYVTPDGRKVRITYDETDVRFFDGNGRSIGHVGIRYVEGEYWHGMPNTLSLYDAEVDAGWRRQGLATHAVTFALKVTGAAHVDGPHHADTMKNDGNFVTTDGARLLEHLREEGLVMPDPTDAAPDGYEDD